MGKMGAYQPTEKYKNYSRPTSKPLNSQAFYTEKVWTVQEQIYKKIKKVAEFLENLYPKLTDDFNANTKAVIEKNVELLIEDLDLMQRDWQKNPDSFNTNKLKINQQRISEMHAICDTLQTVRSYEYEFKNLRKIKHVLHELEHLIQPTDFEKSIEKTRAKIKQKIKKESILVKVKKKTKEDSVVASKKQKAASNKIKDLSKLPKKTAVPKEKLKASEKKVAKPVAKLSKPVKIASKQPKKSVLSTDKPKTASKKVTHPAVKMAAKTIKKIKN